jgi:hypothetical protein
LHSVAYRRDSYPKKTDDQGSSESSLPDAFVKLYVRINDTPRSKEKPPKARGALNRESATGLLSQEARLATN